MAEPASLKRMNQIVNQRAALGAILFLASCGGSEEAQVNSAPDSITTPIVWQTNTFTEDLSALAVSPSGSAVFLFAFENAGLSLVDIDGSPVSEPAPYRTNGAGTGVSTVIEGANLTLFPGISRNADKLVVFVHGEGLVAPIEIELEAEIAGSVEGVCATQSATDGAILDLAYWTTLDRETLYKGTVSAEGSNLLYEPTGNQVFERYLTSCALTSNGTVAGGGFGVQFVASDASLSDEANIVAVPGVPVSLSAVSQGGEMFSAMALSGGRVFIANDAGNFSELEFGDALSSDSPETAGLVAFSERTDIPGFANGFLAVESHKSGEDNQLVLTDYMALIDQLKD